MEELIEDYRFAKDWIGTIKKATEGKFCQQHHSHRHQQQAFDFIDLLLRYERHEGIPGQDKVEKLRSFIDVLHRYQPQVDFSVAAFSKAVELDQFVNDKPGEILKNYQRKKLQYRLGKNSQKNMALHKLAELSELTETMESICRL